MAKAEKYRAGRRRLAGASCRHIDLRALGRHAAATFAAFHARAVGEQREVVEPRANAVMPPSATSFTAYRNCFDGCNRNPRRIPRFCRQLAVCQLTGYCIHSKRVDPLTVSSISDCARVRSDIRHDSACILRALIRWQPSRKNIRQRRRSRAKKEAPSGESCESMSIFHLFPFGEQMQFASRSPKTAAAIVSPTSHYKSRSQRQREGRN